MHVEQHNVVGKHPESTIRVLHAESSHGTPEVVLVPARPVARRYELEGCLGVDRPDQAGPEVGDASAPPIVRPTAQRHPSTPAAQRPADSARGFTPEQMDRFADLCRQALVVDRRDLIAACNSDASEKSPLGSGNSPRGWMAFRHTRYPEAVSCRRSSRSRSSSPPAASGACSCTVSRSTWVLMKPKRGSSITS
jgi:hypothetical protein